MTDAPYIHDAELIVLNAAQTILERLSEEARNRGNAQMLSSEHDFGQENALDYGKAAAHAAHASDAIFDLLNTVNAHNIQRIAYRNLHNHDEPPPAPEHEPELSDESYALAERVG